MRFSNIVHEKIFKFRIHGVSEQEKLYLSVNAKADFTE